MDIVSIIEDHQLNYYPRFFRAEQGRRGWRADPAEARGRVIELLFKTGRGQSIPEPDQLLLGLRGPTINRFLLAPNRAGRIGWPT